MITPNADTFNYSNKSNKGLFQITALLVHIHCGVLIVLIVRCTVARHPCVLFRVIYKIALSLGASPRNRRFSSFYDVVIIHQFEPHLPLN